MYPDEEKIKDIINQYAKGETALLIYRLIPEFVTILKEKQMRVEYIAAETIANHSDTEITSWDTPLEEFLELATKSKTKYDFILVAPEANNMEFQQNHKELIRTIQNSLLKTGGLILLIIRDENFKLDPYIRPGADRITKHTLPETEQKNSSKKPHQAYAFYG